MEDLGSLGRMYSDGEVILKPGGVDDNFYVVQEGKVAISSSSEGGEIPLITCGQGEIIGDWALDFSNRCLLQMSAVGSARVLTVQRKLLLQKIHEDPTLAFRLLEMMSRRLHSLTQRIVTFSQR